MNYGRKRLLFHNGVPIRHIADTLKNEEDWDVYSYYDGPLPNHLFDEYSGNINLYEVIEKTKLAAVPVDIIDKCRSLEDEYGINLSDVLAADRHLGIGWITGGLYHRGALSYMTYEKHLHIVYEVFIALRRYLQEVNPTIVCTKQVGSFVGAIAFAICKKVDIPIYGIMPLNYENYFYWFNDRPGKVPGLEEAYRYQKASKIDISDIDIEMIVKGRKITQSIMQKGRLTDLIPKMANTVKREVIRKLATGAQPPPGGIYFSNRMKYLAQNFFGFRKEMRRIYEPVDQVMGSDYIYYPLHYEPEATLNGIEPHFTNQLYAIETLSKSVPIGINVLVKEHPAGIGNRPSYWIDILEQFPRVKLVSPLENSVDLIRNSFATATITGTSGFEAALLGRPVISFGPNYRFNFIDHVWHANDINKLRKIIKLIRSEYDTQLSTANAIRLRKATEATCFTLDDKTFFTNPSPKSVKIATNALLKLVQK